ncbi:PAS domain S-box protein [Halovenus salina]|uniref:PAS domain S-box protein n=1 Tax=Halovenus salina TaxID=1510225 RepID=A0ABD5VYE4_9EURY
MSDRKERQRRFEAVFNNTYQFTGLMDPDGTLIEINNTALQFGGLDREDVVGERLWDVYWFQDNRQGQEVVRKAVETAQNGSLYRGKSRFKVKSGAKSSTFLSGQSLTNRGT